MITAIRNKKLADKMNIVACNGHQMNRVIIRWKTHQRLYTAFAYHCLKANTPVRINNKRKEENEENDIGNFNGDDDGNNSICAIGRLHIEKRRGVVSRGKRTKLLYIAQNNELVECIFMV